MEHNTEDCGEELSFRAVSGDRQFPEFRGVPGTRTFRQSRYMSPELLSPELPDICPRISGNPFTFSE